MMLTGYAWAEWVLVAKSERGVFFYIDPASIRREGNLRKFWKLADFKDRDKSGYMSVEDLESFSVV